MGILTHLTQWNQWNHWNRWNQCNHVIGVFTVFSVFSLEGYRLQVEFLGKRKKWDTFEKKFFLARKMDEFGVFFWSKTEMWDSLLKKCVVTDCKLEKHKLPLIDHKLSKTVESGDSPDSLDSVESMESLESLESGDSPDSRDSVDSVDSVFATPGGVEIGSSFNAQRAPHTTLRVTYALKSPRAKGWSATR